MRLDSHAGFEELLHPIDVKFFFDEVYERRPMLVSRKDSTFYSEIFGAEDIDSLLGSPATASKFLRMHFKGREIDASRWSRGEEVDAGAVSGLFAEGATLIINGANKFFSRLAAYCNNVERQMRFGVQPNIYITPANSRGFDRHYDDHDVFIMQAHGTKNWRLYGSPVELPNRKQKHEWGKYASLPLRERFMLNPGDLLYIPRGHLHDADTDGEASIHITFGLHPPYLFELVQELAHRSQDSPGFRRAVPGLMSCMDAAEFATRFRAELHALVDETDISELLRTIDRRFVWRRNPGRQAPFLDLLSLQSINDTARVAPAISMVYRLEREGGKVYLRLPGANLMFPGFLEETLKDLLGGESRRIADIPGLLDRNGRLVLVRRLIAAGVLYVGQEGSSQFTV